MANVTDQEKTAVIVARLFGGKWPEHVYAMSDGARAVELHTCHRCMRRAIQETTDACQAWNPFTRIEDAFTCVEKLRPFELYLDLELRSFGWLCEVDVTMAGCVRNNRDDDHASDTPARAITEAIYLVVKE